MPVQVYMCVLVCVYYGHMTHYSVRATHEACTDVVHFWTFVVVVASCTSVCVRVIIN